MPSTRGPVLDFYNELTYLDRKFDLYNYLYSFRYAHHGLLLAYTLAALVTEGWEVEVLNGFNYQDPAKATFTTATVYLNKEIPPPTLTEMTSSPAYLRYEVSQERTDGKTYLIVG